MNLDQFFTPKHKAKKYIDKTNELYPFKGYDSILEPSAGAGAFFNQLPLESRIGLDLVPLHSDILPGDFFNYLFPDGKTLVIGNPPYGSRGSLATRFFNKCADYADVIAFVLPRGFVRPVMQNTLDRRFHLVYEDRLEDFELPDGTMHKVKSVFQIWEKRPILRNTYRSPKIHSDFELKHLHMSWTTLDEIRATQLEYPICVGQNSMKVKHSTEVSKGSIWFIKPKDGNVEKKFWEIDFRESLQDFTAAPSITKGEIITKYKEYEKTNISPL